MQTPVFISDIIPVYNVKKVLLEPCLKAAAYQTLRSNEYEVIIVDDLSTSLETIELCKQYSALHSNFRIIQNNENRGLNHTRLNGLKQAKGNFIMFLDGDDIL